MSAEYSGYTTSYARDQYARTGRKRDPRRILAERAERFVAESLRARGNTVERTPHNEHFDLRVSRDDGSARITVEVKASNWNDVSRRYQAALRSCVADLLILVCYDRGDRIGLFVIPWQYVAGLTHVKISRRDPSYYRGRFARFWIPCGRGRKWTASL